MEKKKHKLFCVPFFRLAWAQVALCDSLSSELCFFVFAFVFEAYLAWSVPDQPEFGPECREAGSEG